MFFNERYLSRLQGLRLSHGFAPKLPPLEGEAVVPKGAGYQMRQASARRVSSIGRFVHV